MEHYPLIMPPHYLASKMSIRNPHTFCVNISYKLIKVTNKFITPHTCYELLHNISYKFGNLFITYIAVLSKGGTSNHSIIKITVFLEQYQR